MDPASRGAPVCGAVCGVPLTLAVWAMPSTALQPPTAYTNQSTARRVMTFRGDPVTHAATGPQNTASKASSRYVGLFSDRLP